MIPLQKIWPVLCLSLLLAACSKQKNEEPLVAGSFKIVSLTTSSDTLMAWDTATISVTTNLPANLIRWEADHGTIIGSGSTITYYAGMCCMGTNTISCRASGSDGADTASIKIHITPWMP
ncbi:MAG: hypothetical protein PHQ65_13065 [Bacteroidales bacterium]|nr:hypothetical protein [Bacteroidales bacterium]